jgi:mannose-6-phosphate isomerase-like protein (cupin superfamily)
MANHSTSSKQTPSDNKSNGEWIEVTPGERLNIRVTSDETDGAYTVFEVFADHRNGTPLHVHDDEEERFVILEGTGQFANGEQRVELSAGASLIVGKGVPHAWCNLSETPLRMLTIFTPGTIDKMFKETDEAPNKEALEAIVKRYGTRIVGPTLFDNIYWKLSPRP